ncbi:ubiquitin-like modifier-activating enzyme 6 [Clytia hemisphaerica]|uniref:E1 ubiquitin-activating enzyme n=1 Tax=Clytia hemisphaerica TaxID=252671 RepID=A0A7M5UEY5_9CNID
MGEPMEIDDSLYSRQRYVLGDGAMHKLSKANVLIIGLGGVGVEVAKNVILAGVKSVTLLDNTKCTINDLGTQFFLRESDVDKPRAASCCQRLAELNPYVNVTIIEDDLNANINVLKDFQCVVVTECTFDEQIKYNDFCRNQQPTIPFISCDVIGVFSYLFCDFGPQFVVHDSDGEEYKEVFIGNISKSNPCTIDTLDYRRHGLQTGDTILLREIKGMDTLNETTHKIKYISTSSFSLELDTTGSEYGPYTHGGVLKKIKQPTTMEFGSLEDQLKTPDVVVNDLSKLDAPILSLIALSTLLKNKDTLTSLSSNEELFLNECRTVNSQPSNPSEGLNEDYLKCLYRTCKGKLAPLCAAIGGICAQEVLKGLSGKFSPLKQWLFLDGVEVCSDSQRCQGEGKYGQLLNCISKDLFTKLQNTRLFMVGCGAIGCEMLKNYALLGISGGQDGRITITDNDLIEKSNLNRQFLFRPWHIQKPKSLTASEAAREINADLQIEAHQNKVSPDTEFSTYNDAFYKSQNVVVNALDNVEARRYVDSRCVTNQLPLLETGTMGPKGHVQVVVPFKTESYSDQRDPVDEDVPYCTLKSFPQIIEHTIQWARDKFEKLFNLKPTTYNKFWETHGTPDTFKQTLSSSIPDGFVDTISLLQKKPSDWSECVSSARIKFEKYFKHMALFLLHAFPLDTKMPDGALFWQSPKRPPTPIEFNASDAEHMTFILSCARLTANVHGIKVTEDDTKAECVLSILQNTQVPEFVPKNKKIETDESKEKEDSKKPQDNDEDKITKLTNFLKSSSNLQAGHLEVEHFEKDDDSNGHIDFITSASNLRATMYNIPTADRFKTKRIAGRIIPAIATTTAAIAGLASLELLKIIAGSPLENLKNCFLNLALPMMVLSEPGAPPKTKIKDGLEFTMWDRWVVKGNANYKLQDFINHFKKTHDLTVSMVCEGVKMIYMPIMPGHLKRPKELMTKLLKPKAGVEYTDLIIGFQSDDAEADEDLPAPPVRYFY